MDRWRGNRHITGGTTTGTGTTGAAARGRGNLGSRGAAGAGAGGFNGLGAATGIGASIFGCASGCLRVRGRGRLLGWHDEVLAGGGLQRDRGADADRQRDLQRHHRADGDHRHPAAEQQDRPATRLAVIQV